MRCSAAVSLIGQTAQSETIHFPEACASSGQIDGVRGLIDGGGPCRRGLMLTQSLVHDTLRVWRQGERGNEALAPTMPHT
jgi:hypothetical protein